MGPIAVRIDIARTIDRQRDRANVRMAVLDALQHAGTFWDDSQIVWLLSTSHGTQVKGDVKVQLDDESSPTLSAVSPHDGTQADSTSSSTWGPFEKAVEASRSDKSLAGVGFVFTADDLYSGVDFHKSLDAAGHIKP